MEFVGGKGQHINVVILDRNRNVSHCLNSIGMEQNIVFSANRSNFCNRQNRADFIVGIHHSNQTSIRLNGSFHLLRCYHSIFVHIQQGDRKALCFQLFQRVQNRMMFKRCGDNVHVSFPLADGCSGTKCLIVCFAAAGSKINFFRVSIQTDCNLFSCFLQNNSSFLSDGVQAGRIAVYFPALYHGCHRFCTHFCGCSVVCINHGCSSSLGLDCLDALICIR